MARLRRKIGSGEVAGRFDQRNTMYCRPRDHDRSDPLILELGRKHYGVRRFGKEDRPGYTMRDWAFAMGCWYMERWWGFGNMVGDEGLYKWYSDTKETAIRDRMTPGEKWEFRDQKEAARHIKKSAKFMGASEAGVCKVDPRWIYSHSFQPHTHEHRPIDDLTKEFEYAIVMVHEMNYDLIRPSPGWDAFASTGTGYSMMAFCASSLAHYIRALGYKAIPCGNDTALSPPMAVDAGLGEIGRSGILINRKFGPRVRISKVFTDLPLAPDKPVEFGAAEFCFICGQCAKECPGQAISHGDPTTEGPTISNFHGIYKWYIDPEKCLRFWVKNGGGCTNCIRSCPFNKPDTRFHRMVKWHVKNLPQFDRFYLWMDKICGYGKRAKSQDVWK